MSQDKLFLAGDDTYKSLLDPENSLTEDECQAALAEVGLQHIVSADGGINTPVAEDSLSHGQKQLLSLAVAVTRAWARRKILVGKVGPETDQRPIGGIVIFDEVTSSVDADTENMIQSVISRVFSEYTVINITHRLESLIKYDAVYVVSQGKITQSQDTTRLIGP